MGADMFISTLVTLDSQTIDFDAGRRALAKITDPAAFSLEFRDDLVDRYLGDAAKDPWVGLDTVEIGYARILGSRLIDDLEKALAGREVSRLFVGQYCVYASGGMSWGDAPTEAATTLTDTEVLPEAVLEAMHIISPAEGTPRNDTGTVLVPTRLRNEERNVEVGLWPADDDEAIVVQVDTGEWTKRLRVNVNDAPVWDGDPERDATPGSYFKPVDGAFREDQARS